MRRFRDILSDQRGNAAIIFGLSIIPLLAFGGGIVDYAHRAQVRSELQNATDSAALAAARVVQLGQLSRDDDVAATTTRAIAAATDIMDAAIANLGGSQAAGMDVDVTEEVISISTALDVETDFLGIIGIDELAAGAWSQVSLPDPILVEIVLVLDYSKSMEDADKYVRMTAAAREFIAKVKKDRGGTSKIGIVPFSEYVRATVPGGVLRDTDPGSTNTPTKACLTNRDYPYSTTDATPSTGVSKSRWPYIDEHDPDCEDYDDHDLEVRDLTDDFQAVSDALASMTPVGLTNISLAAEMGWHVLSPNRPFETARDYSDENLRKIMILLTDGMQTVPASGPGGNDSVEAANDTSAELCDNAKDADISIFSIAYDVSDPVVEDLLLNCASNAASYFDANVNEISDVFEAIYEQIAESVWVSR